jgi:predicted Zn-dependent peptidase
MKYLAGVLLLCTALSCGSLNVATDKNDRAATVSVGEHVFHRRQLDNGLRAVAVRDEGENVSVFVVVGVGKRQETSETTGLAHLTEHAMYTGTERTGPGEHDRRVKEMGGKSNAFTREDYTLFYDHCVPLQHLDEVLAMEADRLRGITFDGEAVLHERERLRIEEENSRQPSVARAELLEAAVYKTHPYGAGVLDEMGHTAAPGLGIPLIRNFYNLYYQPDNTAVVVAGAIDPADALDAVERAFGSLPAGPERPPVPEEPDVPGPRTETLPSALPGDRTELVWLVPALGDPARPGLDALARIISRLTLPDGTSLNASMGSRVDKELFRVVVTDPGTLGEVDTVLYRIRTRNVLAAGVEEIKTLLRDDFTSQPLRARPYFSLAGLFGVYEVLGHAEVMGGYEASIDALSADTIKRLALDHLDPRKKITVVFKGTGEKVQPLPDDPKALQAAAQNAVESGDFDRAIEAFTRLLDKKPSRMSQVIFRASRGQAFMQKKNYDGAIADFERALEIIDYPAVRELLNEARSLKTKQE